MYNKEVFWFFHTGNLLDDNKTISVDAMYVCTALPAMYFNTVCTCRLLTEESDLNDSDDTNRPEWAKASTCKYMTLLV